MCYTQLKEYEATTYNFIIPLRLPVVEIETKFTKGLWCTILSDKLLYTYKEGHYKTEVCSGLTGHITV